MANQLVVLALAFFAVVGTASAWSENVGAQPPSLAVEGPEAAESPNTDNQIGTLDGTPFDAAPVGGPVPEDAFPDLHTAESPKSAATTSEVSAVAGVVAAAAVAGSLFF